MKNFFKKIRSYSFWLGLSGALVLLINSLGNVFGFKIENQIVEDLVMSVAGVLAVLGIVVMPSTKRTDKKIDKFSSNENKEEQAKDLEENDNE